MWRAAQLYGDTEVHAPHTDLCPCIMQIGRHHNQTQALFDACVSRLVQVDRSLHNPGSLIRHDRPRRYKSPHRYGVSKAWARMRPPAYALFSWMAPRVSHLLSRKAYQYSGLQLPLDESSQAGTGSRGAKAVRSAAQAAASPMSVWVTTLALAPADTCAPGTKRWWNKALRQHQLLCDRS